MAALEEFIQEKYVENYESIAELENKAEGLMSKNEYSAFFYIPAKEGIGVLRYIVDSEGHSLYLIKKSGLPEEIREQLVGGEAGEKTYNDYANLNDVYGVTSKLKVYYCSGGLDTLVGLSKDELDNDNPRREVFGKDTSMSGLLTTYDIDGDGTISAEEIKSVKELTINSSSIVETLEELYNFSNLQSLILDNVNLNSLIGLENCPKLNLLTFQNYSGGGIIKDYSSMSELSNLVRLYLVNTTEVQYTMVFNNMKNTNYEKLQYLGIYNSKENITDISLLGNLTKSTKEAVKYLYLYNNKIDDLISLRDFINVYRLEIYSNSTIVTLSGIENMKDLNYLDAKDCNLGQNEIYDTTKENDGKNEEIDSLSALKDKINLKNLYLYRNSNLKWIDYISNLNNLSLLHLSGCSSLVDEAVSLIKGIYNSIESSGNKSIDAKYLFLLNSDERLDYVNLGLNNSSDEIKMLYNNKDVTSLRLDGNPDLTDNIEDGTTHKLSEILATCTNLEVLSLRNITNLNNINFVKNMANLKELDLLGCSNISDLSLLDSYCLKLQTLRINNVNIDLTKIQKAISRLSNSNPVNTFSSTTFYYAGFYTDKKEVISKLGDCTEITKLTLSPRDNLMDFGLIDLTKCSKLSEIDQTYAKVYFKCPESLTLLKITGSSLVNVSDLSLCKRLSYVYLNFQWASGKENIWIKEVGKLENLNMLNIDGVGKGFSNFNLSMDLSSLANCKKLSSFSINVQIDANIKVSANGFSDINSLTNLSLSGLKNFSLNGFENLTKITSMTITNCGVIDLTPIKNLTSITSINFSNNNISSLKSLENLKNLVTLNLSNNTITDDSSYLDDEGKTVPYKNLNIIANLNVKNGGKLENIYLSGNSISDYSLISNLSWKAKSGF